MEHCTVQLDTAPSVMSFRCLDSGAQFLRVFFPPLESRRSCLPRTEHQDETEVATVTWSNQFAFILSFSLFDRKLLLFKPSRQMLKVFALLHFHVNVGPLAGNYLPF